MVPFIIDPMNFANQKLGSSKISLGFSVDESSVIYSNNLVQLYSPSFTSKEFTLSKVSIIGHSIKWISKLENKKGSISFADLRSNMNTSWGLLEGTDAHQALAEHLTINTLNPSDVERLLALKGEEAPVFLLFPDIQSKEHWYSDIIVEINNISYESIALDQNFMTNSLFLQSKYLSKIKYSKKKRLLTISFVDPSSKKIRVKANPFGNEIDDIISSVISTLESPLDIVSWKSLRAYFKQIQIYDGFTSDIFQHKKVRNLSMEMFERENSSFREFYFNVDTQNLLDIFKNQIDLLRNSKGLDEVSAVLELQKVSLQLSLQDMYTKKLRIIPYSQRELPVKTTKEDCDCSCSLL